MKNPFNPKKQTLECGNILYTIDIDTLDSSLIKYFDEKLSKICEGSRNIDLKDVKTKLSSFFHSKKDSDLEMGAIAELIIHLFISTKKFKAEFLFTNLEENSLKKGFDGYYSKKNEEWILESKSGNITTIDISHKSKIAEAYSGLKNKVEGKDKDNNPWENAYKHANLSDTKTKKTIKDKLNDLSINYIRGNYFDIKDFNIIPCSTIFMDAAWENINKKELKLAIEKYLKKKNYKKIMVICINKRAIKNVLDYLNS
ncbi:hypothetical protein [Flavobacterium terrigena]|uniref:Anti-bacteriophage protein A/HamA C-terminal domain-containing protein n=1 Tax=Flavobacterium terrigena TaxID=402734 RepID=A0A1H6SF50_9FLAO|nr:hypothetical protein [Flavobacterium terrigena]SEI62650.1 hypothetical protein SAMN05660918_1197 [Flavobacterium terrigena]